MVLDELSSRERYGLAGAFAVAVLVSGMAGYLGAGMSSPTGAFSGETVSTDEVRSTVQQLMDQQVSRQQQQLELMANQSDNISTDDVSFNAEVQEVANSEFPSFYRVTVSNTGEVPSQTGGIESVDEERVFYISKDGRYLFQQPTDLQQPAQQHAPATGQ